jgi:hypothetical protein
MPPHLDIVLEEIEQVTAAIVDQSSEVNACDMVSLNVALRRRSELMRNLAEALRAETPVGPDEYNRLIVLHVQGTKINSNLLRIRDLLTTKLHQRSRERRYAERLADQVA